MAARVLCFVALQAAAPARAAGLTACASAGGRDVRALPLSAAAAPPAIREISDRLCEYLYLRPVAHELAALAMLVTLLREQSEPIVVADIDSADAFVRLIAAADLARDRLAEERPPAGSSTLAAQRAASAGAELPVLAAAAAAGDVLRAPELARIGLVPADDTADQAALLLRCERQLAVAGVPHLGLLDADPAIAAAELIDAAPPADATPVPVLTVDAPPVLEVPMPHPPADLRAVRAGRTLVLHSAGASRRIDPPAVLGPRRPGRITASDDLLTVTLEPAEDRHA